MSQTVSVPANVSNATLAWYLDVTTEETINTIFDTLDVIVTTDGFTRSTEISNLDAVGTPGQYHRREIHLGNDLDDIRGKDVIITFVGESDASNRTVFRIDDVSFNVESAGGDLPDLYVDEITVAGNSTPAGAIPVGEEQVIKAYLSNAGPVGASGVDIGYYLTTSPSPGQLTIANMIGDDTAALSPFEERDDETLRYTFDSSDVGQRWLAVRVDDALAGGGDVAESNENNNVLWWGPFTIGDVMPAPSLTFPLDGTSSVPVMPTFQWSEVTGANGYWLTVADDPADLPADPSDDTAPNAVISGSTTGTSHTAGDIFDRQGRSVALVPGTTYYWQVQAFEASGNGDAVRQSDFSSRRSFTVATVTTAPATPTPQSPGLTTTLGQFIPNATPTLTWDAVSNADEYGVYISERQANGSYQLVFDSTTDGYTINGDTTSFQLPAGIIQDGNAYRWNLNAWNSVGVSGYSNRLYFRYSSLGVLDAPDAPTNITAVATGTGEITVSWDDVISAGEYRIERSIAGTDQFTLVGSSTAGDPQYVDTEHSQAVPSTSYIYRVTSIANGLTSESVLSASVSLTEGYAESPAPESNEPNLAPYSLGGLLEVFQWDWSAAQAAKNIAPGTLNGFTYEAGLWNRVADFSDTTEISFTDSSGAPRDTIILTHGWNDEFNYQADGFNEEYINIFAADLTMSNGSFPEDDRDLPLILAVDWELEGSIWDSNPNDRDLLGDFLNGGPVAAELDASMSAWNGISLGGSLAGLLSTTAIDPGELALIGHSNGAGFMAGVATGLYDLRGKRTDLLVSLDAPWLTPSYWVTAAANSYVDDLLNYYITPIQFDIAEATDLLWNPPSPLSIDINFGMGAPMLGSGITNFELNASHSATRLDGSECGILDLCNSAHSKAPLRFAQTAGNHNSGGFDAENNWGFVQTAFSGKTNPLDEEGFIFWEFDRGNLTPVVPDYFTMAESAIEQIADWAEGIADGVSRTVTSLWDPAVTGVGNAADAVFGIGTSVWQSVAGEGTWLHNKLNSPAWGSINVTVPADADLLSFELSVIDSGNEDVLLVGFGDQLLGQIDLRAHKLRETITLEFGITEFAGTVGTLHFYSPSGESSTAEYIIGNAEFVQLNATADDPLFADLDGDGGVDDADYGLLFAAFTGPGNGPPARADADLDGDGDVDDADFGLAFAAFTGPGGVAGVAGGGATPAALAQQAAAWSVYDAERARGRLAGLPAFSLFELNDPNNDEGGANGFDGLSDRVLGVGGRVQGDVPL